MLSIITKKKWTLFLVFFAFFLVGSNSEPPFAIAPQQVLEVSSRSPASLLSIDEILQDKEGRIAPDFHIPDGLEKRTRFWFNIYTQYSTTQQVFHHKDYPWIVFHVVDLAPILNSDIEYKNKWTKYHKSRKFLKTERLRIKQTLLKLSKMKNYDSLAGLESHLYEVLKEVPGSRQKVFKAAAYSIRNQLGQKEFIEQGLINSSGYLPVMEQVFTDYGIPIEITRLPFVESSFNVEAQSKVGASGIWQFMPKTGKSFMKVNKTIDERNSPIKSTHAAAKLLKQYKRILGSWPLAITAYNHGVGSLQQKIKKTHAKNLVQIIEHDPDFGFASSNFYSSFLGILYAEKYQKYIFGDLIRQQIVAFKEVRIHTDIKIKKLLRIAKIDPKKFKKYNQDIPETTFQKNSILPRGYIVHLPEKNHQLLVEYFKLQKKYNRKI